MGLKFEICLKFSSSVKSVKAGQADIPRHIACNVLKRIFLALAIAQAMVDILHETVEMHAALAIDRQRIEKRIHQETFPAADAAPEIKAFHRLLAQEYPQQRAPGLFGFDQFVAQPLEIAERAELGRIEGEAVCLRGLPDLVGEGSRIALRRLARRRHQRLIVRLSTPSAASCRDSARVGCACTIRAMSSDAAPNSMATTASEISSDA